MTGSVFLSCEPLSPSPSIELPVTHATSTAISASSDALSSLLALDALLGALTLNWGSLADLLALQMGEANMSKLKLGGHLFTESPSTLIDSLPYFGAMEFMFKIHVRPRACGRGARIGEKRRVSASQYIFKYAFNRALTLLTFSRGHHRKKLNNILSQ